MQAPRARHRVRQTLRGVVKHGLSSTGILRAAGNALKPSVAILRYHSVQANPREQENTIGCGITHATSNFESQMKILASRFHPISLDELTQSLQEGRELRKNSVVVTFDDGYRDNLEIVAPILKKYGIPACFYIIAGVIDSGINPWFVRLRHAMGKTTVDRWQDADGNTHELGPPPLRVRAFLAASRYVAKLTGKRQDDALGEIERRLNVQPLQFNCMLSWEQIGALHRAGHQIGAHTVSHPNVAYISDAEVDAELCVAKKRIEEKLKAPVTHLSYPSPILEPHFSAQSIEASRRAGYRTAVTCTPGVVRLGDDLLSLRRVFARFDPFDFRWGLENAFIGRFI